MANSPSFNSTYTMKTTQANIIYDYCKKQGWDSFMWGDAHILESLYEAAGLRIRNPHPSNKWKAVLNICETNSKTKKPLFRKVRLNLHGQGGISFARMFYLL
jgi:hypothetical protein